MPKLKLSQHSKDSNYYKEMLMKKSSKRQLRFKRFVDKSIG